MADKVDVVDSLGCRCSRYLGARLDPGHAKPRSVGPNCHAALLFALN